MLAKRDYMLGILYVVLDYMLAKRDYLCTLDLARRDFVLGSLGKA